jgi:hypothetical protein
MMMGMREKGGVERAMGVEKEKKLMRGRGGGTIGSRWIRKEGYEG